jgi:hypothetical protein
MTTIRQLIQTSPERANELFSKLVDTSENAVKTREKLFSELKEELESLAALEEQHLFPVLRKHKDLKDLVRDALNDNKATRKLLAELDHTPKDSEEFAARVGELRKVFQQHVRDERKELLPAVLKALTDEEAGAVVEKIEAGKAEIEEAKRQEAEQRRAEARREREKAEAAQAKIDAARRAEAEERRAAARQAREEAERLQQAADAVVSTAWAAPRTAEKAALTAQEIVRSGVGTLSEVAQGTTERVTQAIGLVGDRNRDLTERASQNMRALTESGSVLARTVQDVTSEWIGMAQERLHKNLDAVNELARCRTLPDLLAAQSAMLRSNMELTLTNGQRLAELSARLVEEASRPVANRAQRSTSRAA